MIRELLLILAAAFLLAGMTHADGSESEFQQLATTTCGNGEEIILSKEQDTASAADALQQRDVAFRITASPDTPADAPRQLWHATTTFTGAIHPWPYWEASLVCDEARNRLLLTLVFNRGVTAVTLDIFPIALAGDAETQSPRREQPVAVAPDLTERSLVHYAGDLSVDSGGVESVHSELRDDVLAVTIYVRSEYIAPLDFEIDLATGEIRQIGQAPTYE